MSSAASSDSSEDSGTDYTQTVKNINDKSLIKDIYTLSLSVEKDLFVNLADF